MQKSFGHVPGVRIDRSDGRHHSQLFAGLFRRLGGGKPTQFPTAPAAIALEIRDEEIMIALRRGNYDQQHGQMNGAVVVNTLIAGSYDHRRRYHKTYRDTVAVAGLSFRVEAGRSSGWWPQWSGQNHHPAGHRRHHPPTRANCALPDMMWP